MDTPSPAQWSDELAIKRLLTTAGLPGADLTPAHLARFLVLRDADQLGGVVGLEVFGAVALLRSLAVPTSRRGQGLGTRLAEAAEDHARSLGVAALYLLTTTAESFFARRGYRRIDRADAPAALHATAEFASLCPSTAVCMVKELR